MSTWSTQWVTSPVWPSGADSADRAPADPCGRARPVRRRRTVASMSDDQPDPYADAPRGVRLPGAGERVSDEDRQRALDAEPDGNATVGDTVDTDGVDSSAHEEGPGSQEVAEQVRDD